MGNIRDIFSIVSELLPYILKNQNNKSLIIYEDERKKIRVLHNVIIEKLTKENSKYKLINLNEHLSSGTKKEQKNNSLYINIMEACEIIQPYK